VPPHVPTVNRAARRIRAVYLLLQLFHTLAASLIWGINTLFLLDAGLDNTEAFTVNAFFTAGMVIFEVPTGVLADTRGRRTSYLVGTFTLAVATMAYLALWHFEAPFWSWLPASIAIGLGFTFFSGAVEAWLVDALSVAGFFQEGGSLEAVLARGEIVEGAAMLAGSVAGGILAQASNLGAPYVVRVVLLCVSFAVAFVAMHDEGFTPRRGERVATEVMRVLRASIHYGFGNRPVRWIMLAAPFEMGVSFYAFYAMQPWLLELYGDEGAYAVAGLAAAIVAGAQIIGGLLVPQLRQLFQWRTSLLLTGSGVSALVLVAVALLPHFVAAVLLLVLWALMFAATTPVRQAFLNGLIPSAQRATVLSFDSLLGSAGAAGLQPLLGRSADLWGYPASYACGAALQALALPFLWLARRERAPADPIVEAAGEKPAA